MHNILLEPNMVSLKYSPNKYCLTKPGVTRTTYKQVVPLIICRRIFNINIQYFTEII